MGEEWLRVLDRYGVPLVALVVFVWMAQKGIRTFWGDIVIPARDKLIGRWMQFFDKLDGALDATLERDREAEKDRRLHELLAERDHELLEDVYGEVKRNSDVCAEILSHVTGRPLPPSMHRRPKPTAKPDPPATGSPS